MGNGRVSGKQLRDETISSDELEDGILEERHFSEDSIPAIALQDEAKEDVLKFKTVLERSSFTLAIAGSEKQSIPFPENPDVIFSRTIEFSDIETRLFVDTNYITESSTAGEMNEARLIFSDRHVEDEELIASTYNFNITFLSTDHTIASEYNFDFDADDNKVRWNGGDWFDVVEGLNLIKGTTNQQYLILNIESLSGALSGINTYGVTVKQENRIGFFDRDSMESPIFVPIGSYTAVYPKISNLDLIDPKSTYNVGSLVGIVPGEKAIDELTLLELVDPEAITKTIILPFTPLLPPGVDNANAPKYIKLLVNNELQSPDRFTYNILTKTITWDAGVAEWDLSEDDVIYVYKTVLF